MILCKTDPLQRLTVPGASLRLVPFILRHLRVAIQTRGGNSGNCFRRIMLRVSTRVLPLIFILFFSLQSNAQSVTQFWPEVDFYAPITSDMRFKFEIKDTREGQQSQQLQVGPSIEFYVKPLLGLRRLSTLPKDEARSRILVLSAGYRYLPGTSKDPAENRIILSATPNYPLVWKIILSDRNQFELRFISSGFNWRYRNRLALQRPFQLGSYKFTPYVRCEEYYSSQYSKWYDTALSAGANLPLTKELELNPYYEHQNETNKSPNKIVHSLGLALSIFF
jgi:hypothetical protein